MKAGVEQIKQEITYYNKWVDEQKALGFDDFDYLELEDYYSVNPKTSIIFVISFCFRAIINIMAYPYKCCFKILTFIFNKFTALLKFCWDEYIIACIGGFIGLAIFILTTLSPILIDKIQHPREVVKEKIVYKDGKDFQISKYMDEFAYDCDYIKEVKYSWQKPDTFQCTLELHNLNDLQKMELSKYVKSKYTTDTTDLSDEESKKIFEDKGEGTFASNKPNCSITCSANGKCVEVCAVK